MGDIKGTDLQYSYAGPGFDSTRPLNDMILLKKWYVLIWSCLNFLKILPSVIIQNKGKFLCFGVLVRKMHKLKLGLMKYFFEKIMNFELLHSSKKWQRSYPHNIAFSLEDFVTSISLCIISPTFLFFGFVLFCFFFCHYKVW